MTIIKPVSDLRNYTKVLRDIQVGTPVYLTKNGRGKYVMQDIADYEKMQATIKLFAALAEGEASVKTEEDWISLDNLKKELGF